MGNTLIFRFNSCWLSWPLHVLRMSFNSWRHLFFLAFLFQVLWKHWTNADHALFKNIFLWSVQIISRCFGFLAVAALLQTHPHLGTLITPGLISYVSSVSRFLKKTKREPQTWMVCHGYVQRVCSFVEVSLCQ